jgi:hypothetical protein
MLGDNVVCTTSFNFPGVLEQFPRTEHLAPAEPAEYLYQIQ